MIRKTALLAGVAALFATSAYAADLPSYEAPPPVEPVAVAPVANWTGFYVGAGAGYSWYDPDLEFDFEGGAAGFTSDGADYDLSSFLLQGTIGADVQLGRFVVGALADVKWNPGDDDADVEIFDATPASIGVFPSSVDSDWGWSVLGRAGFLVTDRVLAYGLAGWSWRYGELEYTDPDGGGAAVPVDYSYDADTDGFTVGGGVEALVTNMVSVKGEYRYTDFDDISEDLGGAFDGTGSSVSLEGEQHEFLLGVNVRFNGLFQ